MKPNIGQLMRQAQQLQANMQKAQEQLGSLEVTGEAGGGMVKVVMNGRHEVRRVEIDPTVAASDREMLEAASPLPRIDRVRAPLFVIHGANDPRVPLSEAEQVVAAVRANGLECELRVYDDEGHGLAKRANRLDAYPAAARFLDRCLAPGGARAQGGP